MRAHPKLNRGSISSYSGEDSWTRVWKWIHKSGFYVFMIIYFYDFVLEPILLISRLHTFSRHR